MDIFGYICVLFEKDFYYKNDQEILCNVKVPIHRPTVLPDPINPMLLWERGHSPPIVCICAPAY